MDNINKTLMDNEEFLNEERNKKRDEKAKLVQEHFDKIGAATYDVFKYGWIACAKEYENENKELKRKLEIAEDALLSIEILLSKDCSPKRIFFHVDNALKYLKN